VKHQPEDEGKRPKKKDKQKFRSKAPHTTEDGVWSLFKYRAEKNGRGEAEVSKKKKTGVGHVSSKVPITRGGHYALQGQSERWPIRRRGGVDMEK